MKFKAGTLDDFANSMAADMESAFELVWNARMGTSLPAETRDDRRMLFVAIAQGVLRHFKENAVQGFDVDVLVKQTVDGTSGPLMDSTGATTTGHSHNVSVTQKNTSNNMLKSVGKGDITIKTAGELYS